MLQATRRFSLIAVPLLLISCGTDGADPVTGTAGGGDATSDAGAVGPQADTGAADGELADVGAGDAGAVADVGSGDDAGEVAAEVAEDAAIADDATASGDTGTPSDVAAGGIIAIYLKGDYATETFTDGLQGQTASDFEIALSRYVLLKSADDASPQPCFDHGAAAVVAKMAGDNLMGSCANTAIESGLYTHGRVKVDWSRYTVSGQLHYAGQVLPGKFTFLRAWSDTSIDGAAFKAGDGTLRFQDITGAVDTVVPYTYPPMPPQAGMTTETVGGEFSMTFAYKKALPVQSGVAADHWARFHWHLYEGFRWKDAAQAGFGAGVWDVVPSPGVSEEVLVPGMTDYHVTSSVD